VADFGASRHVGAGDASNLTAGVGTPIYLAPETIGSNLSKRHSSYSGKVDVYSFALTAWSCVNREVPFAQDSCSVWDLRAKIADGMRPKITRAFDSYR
jgi:serine/threonine protein kinase